MSFCPCSIFQRWKEAESPERPFAVKLQIEKPEIGPHLPRSPSLGDDRSYFFMIRDDGTAEMVDHRALKHVLKGVEIPQPQMDGSGRAIDQEETLTAIGDGPT